MAAQKTQHIIDNGGVKLDCTSVFNMEAGWPTLVIPGMATAGETLAELAAPFIDTPTYFLSLRGRGQSSSPTSGYTLENQASDVVATIEHFGWSKVLLVGHSVGASISMYAAEEICSKLAGLVIIDFAPFYPPFGKNWGDRIRKQGNTGLSDIAIDGIVRDAAYKDVTAHAQACEIPKLLIKAGGDSSLLKEKDISRMVECFPGLIVQELPGTGHEVFNDDPAGVMQAVAKFRDSLAIAIP